MNDFIMIDSPEYLNVNIESLKKMSSETLKFYLIELVESLYQEKNTEKQSRLSKFLITRSLSIKSVGILFYWYLRNATLVQSSPFTWNVLDNYTKKYIKMLLLK